MAEVVGAPGVGFGCPSRDPKAQNHSHLPFSSQRSPQAPKGRGRKLRKGGMVSRLQEGQHVLATSMEYHVRNHQNPPEKNKRKESGFVPTQLPAEGKAGVTPLSYSRVETGIILLTHSPAGPTFPSWGSPKIKSNQPEKNPQKIPPHKSLAQMQHLQRPSRTSAQSPGHLTTAGNTSKIGSWSYLFISGSVLPSCSVAQAQPPTNQPMGNEETSFSTLLINVYAQTDPCCPEIQTSAHHHRRLSCFSGTMGKILPLFSGHAGSTSPQRACMWHQR